MSKPPIFGQEEPGRTYKLRPSAYAIVTDHDGLIAVVRTANGCYLPGGGIEPGEDATQAVVRECEEECGFTPDQVLLFGSATQLLFAPGEGWFRIEGQFYSGVFARHAHMADHSRCDWESPSRASLLMTRAFERWAIQKWMDR